MSTIKFFFAGKHYSIYRISLGIISIAVLFLFFISCDVNNGDDNTDDYVCDEIDSVGVWKFLGLENETITAIAVHPQKPNIIFAGTSKDFSAGIPGRLYRSKNCGKSWQLLFEGVGYAQSVDQILFDPNNPNIIYAIPHPILKSTDCGNTWKDISYGIRLDWETQVASIAIDPYSSNILYAGTAGPVGGSLYKTVNGGQNWQELYRNEDETPGLRGGVISLSIDETNSNLIYAGTADIGVLVKSVDAGYTWTITGLGTTGRLINSIAIDKNSSQTIYVAIGQLLGLRRSADGGISWQPFNEGIGDSVNGGKIITNQINADLFCIAGFQDNSGVFIRKQNNQDWVKFNTSNIIISFYSDIYITEDGKYLFLGSYSGVYKIRLE